MNTRAINSATGVINAALTQNRTAAGIALALDAAGLLMTQETAAELTSLRERFAVSDHPADEDPIAYALTEQAAEPFPPYGGHDPGCAYVSGMTTRCTCPEDDVRPQVRKLRSLLAGQRTQAGEGQ